MNLGKRMVGFSLDHPGLVTGVMVGIAAVLIALVALPSLWPETFPMLSGVKVDTDPENMLSSDEPVRVFHNRMKEAMSLYEIIVVGVVNDTNEYGVFNPETLRKVYDLTKFATTLHWQEGDQEAGVIPPEVIAPSEMNVIVPSGDMEISFEELMPEPPKTQEEALAIRDKALRVPFFRGTLISEDEKALAIYLPITSKDTSYRIYQALNEKISELGGPEQFHVTGLPVANDTFGVEMFIQMAISAPLAMLTIFILMLLFFRKLLLILSPMILAMVTVIVTMGLLIVTGNTVHIMSSMIPIFLMPIAVLDSVHILSEFFERYQETRDRRKTMAHVMETLFMPMLYTSLTTAAGFGSLAITPIPPVQIFGAFVAFGVMFAWVFTVTFVPAFVMFIPQKRMENFGAVHAADRESGTVPAGSKTRSPAQSPFSMARFLDGMGEFTYRRVKLILAFGAAAVAVTLYGMTQIVVNDNPTKWFKASHPIRVADTVLNSHFGGTYMAYVAVQRPAGAENVNELAGELRRRIDGFAAEYKLPELAAEVKAELDRVLPEYVRRIDVLKRLQAFATSKRDAARDQNSDARYDWEELIYFLDAQMLEQETFKRPEVLAWVEKLQAHLHTVVSPQHPDRPLVGKSSSITDIVKTVHRDLFGGADEHYTVPEKQRMVGECVDQFQNGNRRLNDLWHFVTSDYQTASIWVQLRGGDNQDMSRVAAAADAFAAQNPPPDGLRIDWFGLTYINVIWQEKMVLGMMSSFFGSFLIVLLMMIVLFRSGLWGLLSMIPLTITIGLIYGVIGLIGKDYDMPVAVLSALTLGLAVDFAIHFLARAQSLYEKHGSWKAAHAEVFGEPARAIMRNVVVIAVGFLPLLAAPLVPYVTVGVFMAAILLVSGVGTLILLPALVTVLEGWLFPQTPARRFTCRFGTLFLSAASAVGVVVLNITPFMTSSQNLLMWVSAGAMPVIALICWLVSRRAPCSVD